MNESINKQLLGDKSWKNSTYWKAALIAFLTLVLLIPMAMVENIIDERNDAARSAEREVMDKYSGEQRIYAPTLTIPYIAYTTVVENDSTKRKASTYYLHILPDSLRINSDINTETLRRSIFDVVVYGSHIDISGTITVPSSILNDSKYLLDEAEISIGLSDLRGIKDQLYFTYGDTVNKMESGVGNCMIFGSGANTKVKISRDGKPVNFSLSFNLNGSSSMEFVPLGETTEVSVKSNCPTPSFQGKFLPETREVTENGFSAYWKILHLNRNYGQHIKGTDHQIDDSAFGVDVLEPLQHYQKSTRCAKYAVLIILLTFVACFFTELIQNKNVHTFQYLLVGLALCLFYSLLVSLSEHVGFSAAYIIAAVMTAGMLTVYLSAVLKERKMGLIIGGLLMALYIYVFVLVNLETYALLAGSIGLFCILASIMYMSQRIDWSSKH